MTSNDTKKMPKGVPWAVILGFWGLVGLLLLLLNLSNPAEEYLGHWKGKTAGDHIVIQKMTGSSKPDEILKLADGKTAYLLLPVTIPNIIGRGGGIYKVGTKHALVLWCHICESNVVMGLRKTGDKMELGLFDKTPDSVGGAMGMTHSKPHRKYNPKKWVSYVRVSQ